MKIFACVFLIISSLLATEIAIIDSNFLTNNDQLDSILNKVDEEKIYYLIYNDDRRASISVERPDLQHSNRNYGIRDWENFGSISYLLDILINDLSEIPDCDSINCINKLTVYFLHDYMIDIVADDHPADFKYEKFPEKADVSRLAREYFGFNKKAEISIRRVVIENK